jgi:hypothetical protein
VSRATHLTLVGLAVIAATVVGPLQGAPAFATGLPWRLLAAPTSLGPGPTFYAVPYPGALGWQPTGDAPTLSVAGTGALASWAGPKGEVLASMSDRLGDWQPVLEAGAAAGGETPEIVAATDPRGDALLGWAAESTVRYPSTTWRLASAYLPAGAPAWSPPLPIAEASAPNLQADGPALAFDPRGNGLAAWRPPNSPEILAASMPAGTGAWQAPVVLSPTLTPSGRPLLAVDAAGDALAVWEYPSASGRGEVAAAVRPAGRAWRAPMTLGPRPSRLAVAALAGRRVALLWLTEGQRGRGDLLYQTGNLAAGRFSGLTEIQRNVESSSQIGLAVAARGRLLAWWQNAFYAEEPLTLRVRARAADGRWARRTVTVASWPENRQESALAEPPSCLGYAPPAVGFDAHEDAVAAWGEACGTAFASELRAGGRRWSRPAALDPEIGRLWDVGFAIEPTGTLLAAGFAPQPAEGPFHERVPTVVTAAALRFRP